MEKLLNELASKVSNEASEWIVLYLKFCEAVDDIQDEERDIERTLRAFDLARKVYNHPYWCRNRSYLYTTDVLIANMWGDSEQLKIKIISHAAIEMIFALINFELGFEELRRFSTKYREFVYTKG